MGAHPLRASPAWLASHPPSQLIVLPRYSYTQDGKSDNCTTAWFVWLKHASGEPMVAGYPQIVCVPDAETIYGD